MYKICKTAESANRQKQFQNTLFHMMEKQSYEEITISALCRQMNAPRKAFYRYFDTIEDVLNATLDMLLLECLPSLEVYGKEGLSTFFEYWKKQIHILNVLEKHGLSTKLIDRIYVLVVFSNIQSIKDLTSIDMKYSCYISSLINMLILWHHSGMKQEASEIADIMKEVFS